MQLCLFEESYDVWLTYPTGKISSMWRFQTVDLKTFFRRLCVSKETVFVLAKETVFVSIAIP